MNCNLSPDLLERGYIYDGQCTFTVSYRFGNQPAPPQINTFRDLIICLWSYCARKSFLLVPVLTWIFARIAGFLFQQLLEFI